MWNMTCWVLSLMVKHNSGNSDCGLWYLKFFWIERKLSTRGINQLWLFPWTRISKTQIPTAKIYFLYIKLELPNFLSGHEKQNFINALTTCSTKQVKLHDRLIYLCASSLMCTISLEAVKWNQSREMDRRKGMESLME